MSPQQRLAVIPARGGSKRLPHKNILPLAGKPLLVYTVEAALGSGCFDRVVVSTDDDRIADVARAAGADVPFVRSADTADDHTPVSAVTVDALQRLASQGEHYTVVAQLLPNCPLRDADDVRASFVAFDASAADFQISVTAYGWLNPWWAMKLGEQSQLEPLFEDALRARSQDLAALYCPIGAIWWARSAALATSGTFYGPDVRGFPLAWQHAVDIDDEGDLAMAEALLAMRSPAPVSSPKSR